MNTKVADLINKQINLELYSAYLYFNFRNYYAGIDLDGFENWFHVQTQEELSHALLLVQYLYNNEENVILKDIKAPDTKISGPAAPLKLAYEHEKCVSAHINHIYHIAFEEKDYRTSQLLDWFIKEQGEEEKTVSTLVSKMELFGNDTKGLYLLNNELLSRTYTAPTLTL